LIYLDANATEPLRPEARAAQIEALDVTGNPASVHQAGRQARRVLEAARSCIAAIFQMRAQDLVFTSGATEANALAIAGLGSGRTILIGATEHDAVRAAAPDALILPVTMSGNIDLGALEQALAADPGAFVALMAANNETGVLHPLLEIGALCRTHHALLHVDAAQAAGRLVIDYFGFGAASVAISSHKLGGPAGAGALLLAPAHADRLPPLIKGGGQERGRRGGTPNLPAIAGFAAAAAAAQADMSERVQRQINLRDEIEAAAVEAGAVIIGGGQPRLANTVCLAQPGVSSERQVIGLDLDGICVSAGAACSSGKVTRSHVLLAMGLGDLAGQSIRISLPWNGTAADAAEFIAIYKRLARRDLRKPAEISTAAA
jgi:cysteine desulfurase